MLGGQTFHAIYVDLPGEFWGLKDVNGTHSWTWVTIPENLSLADLESLSMMDRQEFSETGFPTGPR